METIRQYLISVIIVSIVCSIVAVLFSKKGLFGAVLKMLSGVLLVITVISPWKDFNFRGIEDYLDAMMHPDATVNHQTVLGAKQTLGTLIKEETEAYILSKATDMELDVTIDVQLSQSEPPVPEMVTICGSLSPYEKQKLKGILIKDLGILEENLIWI